MTHYQPISPTELLISLGILALGWAVVFAWEHKAARDRAKRDKWPSATKMDEHERKISE